jgi:hypothetical protein
VCLNNFYKNAQSLVQKEIKKEKEITSKSKTEDIKTRKRRTTKRRESRNIFI